MHWALHSSSCSTAALQEQRQQLGVVLVHQLLDRLAVLL